MERLVKALAKLYECRDAAKRFYKAEYQKTLKPYTTIIKAVMAKNKVNEIEAVLIISKTETYQDSAMNQMLFMAAAVEISENPKL